MPSFVLILAALLAAAALWFLAPALPRSLPQTRWPWAALGRPLLAALLLGWLGGSVVLGFLVLAVWPLGPRLRAWQLERQRREALAEQMPALLEALAGGLRAGQSLPQALASAVEDLPEPSATLAQGLLHGLKLGEAPEALMLAQAGRFGEHALASDWRLLATAVALQRSSGGDLAATLDQLTETLRERQRLQAQVDALTAQGRLSAWIVGLLPLLLLAALQLMDPDLVAPLFHTQTGWVLLGLAVLMESAGMLLLRRIVDVGV